MTYDAYTYIIKCPNGKSYYGYRSANKVSPEDDLWKVYFTSSKRIKELREQYDDAEFVASVDKTFKTAEEAHEYETKFLMENDCVHSDDWLNEQCFPVFVDTTGYKHTEKTKKKMSKAQKGRTLTEEHRKNLSKAKKGRNLTEEHRKNLSKALKGQIPWNKGKTGVYTEAARKKMGTKHTEKTKKKISESLKKYYAKEKRNKENVSIEIHGQRK